MAQNLAEEKVSTCFFLVGTIRHDNVVPDVMIK